MAKYTTKKKPPEPFMPLNYTMVHEGLVIIEGQKFPPPSKRITLKQKNIRVKGAKIIAKTKKGDVEFEVIRINRVKSFGEVRLHTKSMLYPGVYEVTLEYYGELNKEIASN